MMVTDLQLLVDDTEEYERPIARLIATTVAYEADTGLKAAKLANDIKFICQAEDIKVKSRSNGSTEGIEEVLSNIWYLVIDIARLTPPNHPRQNCLVEAVEILRQTEGTAPSMVSNVKQGGGWEMESRLMTTPGSKRVVRST